MRNIKGFGLAVVLLVGCTVGEKNAPIDLPDAKYSYDASIDATIDAFAYPDPREETCTEAGRGATVGNTCVVAEDCDDGCFCNGQETCPVGVCMAAATMACDDSVECTADACVEEIDTCEHDPRSEMCSDGDACNGAEYCDLRTGCENSSPLYCNDENSCTFDSCDSEVGCLYSLRDLDRDTYTDGRCGGDDCNDASATVNVGAPEVCTNRIDDNCDGARDYADSTCSPTNEDCATAETITRAGTFSGSTRGLARTLELGCTTGTGPDAVFKLVLDTMKDVKITVSGAGSGSAVALRPFDMCATGPDEKCASSAAPVVLRRSLPAGEWAVIVKTASTAGVSFDLVVDLDEPTAVPLFDECASNTIDISAGGAFTGDFVEVDNDYALSCHPSTTTTFKDVAYRLVLDSPKDVVLSGRVTTTGGFSGTAYVSLLTDCSDATSTLQCIAATTAEVRQRPLAAGTYYVLLESSAVDSPSWTLNATITDPAPRNAGDACSSALDISSTMQTVAMSTIERDASPSCQSGTAAKDAFFYFDLAETRDVTVRTTAPSTHAMSLSTTCGVTSSELRCRSGSSPQEQLWRSLPAGRYYIAVSSTATSGMISATVTTAAPTLPPANDRCDGAIEIGGPGGYFHRDTLTGFEDDYAGCTGSSYPDAFYKLTLTERRFVQISATRATGSSTLYMTLKTTCGGAGGSTGATCDSGSPALITTTLDAGTYYLYVESTGASVGDFNLAAATFPAM